MPVCSQWCWSLPPGCGDDADRANRGPASHTSTAAPATATADRCGEADVGAQPIRFRTSDGVALTGAVAGSGPVGASMGGAIAVVAAARLRRSSTCRASATRPG